jgi:hypothetical protein
MLNAVTSFQLCYLKGISPIHLSFTSGNISLIPDIQIAKPAYRKTKCRKYTNTYKKLNITGN